MNNYYDTILYITIAFAIVGCIPLLSFLTKKQWWKRMGKWEWWKDFGFRKIARIFGVLAILLSVFLIVCLFIDTSPKFIMWQVDTEKWYQFASILGAFLLAATLLFQIRSFRRQQVEAKFFELVKYYRDNISEMRFRNPFYYVDGNRKVEEEFVYGRRVMKTIFEQYKVARKVCHNSSMITCCFRSIKEINKIESKWSKKEFDKTKNNELFKFDWDEWNCRFSLNEIAYQITFWGIPIDTDKELQKYTVDILGSKNTTNLMDKIKNIVTVWEFEEKHQANYSSNLKAKEGQIFDNLIKPIGSSKKVKFFGGHQYHLGHYFRHLFQAVKFIDNQPSWLMSQKEKYDYVKTLRAQMSNYEQAMLFINSLSKLGRNWEYDNDEKNLISDYNLIKNLPENFIPYMKPQYYYPDVDFEWDLNNKKKLK